MLRHCPLPPEAAGYPPAASRFLNLLAFRGIIKYEALARNSFVHILCFRIRPCNSAERAGENCSTAARAQAEG